MGIFSIFSLFKKKPKNEDSPDYSTLGLSSPTLGPPEDMKNPPPNPMDLSRSSGFPSLPSPIRTEQSQTKESINQDNMRAKLDLMSTQLESIRMQQESVSQRIAQIEQMVKQLLHMSGR